MINSGHETTPGHQGAEVNFPWFALQVRARRESGVADYLRGRGYQPFLPIGRIRKVWSDRIQVAEVPLFPGYLFCRVNIEDRLPILSAPGVIRIVGYSRSPVPVDESEMNAIHTIVASGRPNEPWPYLRTGDPVQISSGPLEGLRGILLRVKGAHRLIVSVTLVQRSVAVEIDSAYVKSLSSEAHSPYGDSRTNGDGSELVTCWRH